MPVRLEMSSNRGDPKLDESFILPIRSAEIARSNPRSKKDTDSADVALAEREGFEPPMGLHP